VKGVLDGGPQGTTMTATVRPHLVWATVWGAWLAFWTVSALLVVLTGVDARRGTIAAGQIAFVVIATYLIWLVPFNFEIKRIRKNLDDVAMLR